MVGRERTAMKRPLTVTATLASMVVLVLIRLENTVVHAWKATRVLTVRMIQLRNVLPPRKFHFLVSVGLICARVVKPVTMDFVKVFCQIKIKNVIFS